MATREQPRAAHPTKYGVSMAASANGRNSKAVQRRRKVDGVITEPLTVKSVHPSERLPQWAKPLPNEDTRKYAERLGFAIHQDSLHRSLGGDTAAHAKWREQALKGLGLGQRTEIDISAKQGDDWLKYLTDQEIQTLDMLHKAALQRMSTPPIEHNPDNSQGSRKALESKDSQASPRLHNDHYPNLTNGTEIVVNGADNAAG